MLVLNDADMRRAREQYVRSYMNELNRKYVYLQEPFVAPTIPDNCNYDTREYLEKYIDQLRAEHEANIVVMPIPLEELTDGELSKLWFKYLGELISGANQILITYDLDIPRIDEHAKKILTACVTDTPNWTCMINAVSEVIRNWSPHSSGDHIRDPTLEHYLNCITHNGDREQARAMLESL